MSGFDYGGMQGVASRLLTRFNQGVVTLTKKAASEGTNDWTPGETVSTAYPLQATVKGVSSEFIDGTTVLATDLEVTAAAFGAEPSLDDNLSIDGKPMTLVRVIRVPAAGTVICWRFLLRA